MTEKQIEEGVDSALAEQSFYHFFKQAFNVLEPHKKFKDNWHYRYICDILQKEVERIGRHEPSNFDVIIINVPPRTAKSYIVARCLNAWAWIHYPWMRFVTASYSSDLALSHSLDTHRIIMSEWYQERWGDKVQFALDKNTQTRFDTVQHGMRYSIGVGGSATGEGGDCIIVDDAVSALQADSVVERNKANRWWDNTFFNRLNDRATGIRIVVMQRLHEGDLTGHILKKDYRIKHICLPAELKKSLYPQELAEYYQDGLLFPSDLSKAELSKQLSALGPYGYAGQMNQMPSPEGGGKIKKHWFPVIRANELPQDLPRYTYVDPSEGKKNSDEMASICWSVYKGKMIIWEVLSVVESFDKFVGARDKNGDYENRTYELFLQRNNCYNNQTYNFWEAKSLGQGYVDYINSMGLPFSAIGDNPGSDSKEVRAYREIPVMYAGRVLLVDGAWVEGFLNQVEIFPNGSQDGQVDVLAAAIRKSDLGYIPPKEKSEADSDNSSEQSTEKLPVHDTF